MYINMDTPVVAGQHMKLVSATTDQLDVLGGIQLEAGGEQLVAEGQVQAEEGGGIWLHSCGAHMEAETGFNTTLKPGMKNAKIHCCGGTGSWEHLTTTTTLHSQHCATLLNSRFQQVADRPAGQQMHAGGHPGHSMMFDKLTLVRRHHRLHICLAAHLSCLVSKCLHRSKCRAQSSPAEPVKVLDAQW
jgi:hypothetical protein